MYKTAGQDGITLYCLMGEALCMIQHLEGALSCSITLKKDIKHPRSISKEDAEKVLEKYRSIPLGKAVGFAKGKKLYSSILHNDLVAILTERNWLVHKCILSNLDDMYMPSSKAKLFHRIKTISNEAKRLQNAIETDLIEYFESYGIDMSKARAYMKQSQGEPVNIS